MIGDDDLAALVRAILFQLVRNSTGEVIAELTDSIDTGGIPPLIVPGILMHHLETAGTWPEDGYLGWSAPNTRDGYPIVRLAGPADTDGNLPYVELQSSGLDETAVQIAASGSAAGVARYAEIDVSGSGTTATVGITAGDDTAAHGFTTLTVKPEGLRLDNLITGRNAYMMTGVAFATPGGATALVPAGVAIGAAVVINCIAGDVIAIDAVFDFRCTVLAAGCICIGRVLINGVWNGREALATPSGVGIRGTHPVPRIFYTAPADGAYTISLKGYKTAAGGAYWADYDSGVAVTTYSRQ